MGQTDKIKCCADHHGSIGISVQNRIPKCSLLALLSGEACELSVHAIENLSARRDPSCKKAPAKGKDYASGDTQERRKKSEHPWPQPPQRRQPASDVGGQMG